MQLSICVISWLGFALLVPDSSLQFTVAIGAALLCTFGVLIRKV